MRWLITINLDADLDELGGRLAALGIQVDSASPPIPLGENEQVIGADGPANADQKLAGDQAIIGVYPDSEYELYDGTPT